MSKYTEHSKTYTINYIREKLDEIKIRVPKGQKANIREHAGQMGEKLTPFILRAIRETMERDVRESNGNALPTDGQSDAPQDAPCGGGEELPTETETPVNGL